MNGYFLPPVNLGATNFLDGGPLRPQPGWYWTQFEQYYYADTYLDVHGKKFNQFPTFNNLSMLTAVAYQFKPSETANFQIGFSAALPIILYSKVGHNSLNLVPDINTLSSSGSGIADMILGAYVQFDAITYRGRPIFVQRLEFDTYFPTGKYDTTQLINPGYNMFYIDPYWSFTFYILPKLATSWRIFYLHCGEDHTAKLKPGNAIHFNYTLEGEALPNVWMGINGYFLQQIKNSKINDIEVPHSKEQLFATGFGALYEMTPDDNFFFNLYFECEAKNRPRGISFFFRFFKHF
jgi:hypothetical protein